MKKLSLFLMALVVLAAAIWQGITLLGPDGSKIRVSTAASAHRPEVAAAQQSPSPGSLGPTPAASTKLVPKEGVPMPNPPQETPIPGSAPAATVQPDRPLVPEKNVLASSLLPKESSPPLLAAALPPPVPGSSVAPIKQQAAEQPEAPTNNNPEPSGFEPTTLTVMRTFVLTLPGGGQIEQSVSIPVLYRKGSIALKADQLEQLGAIQSQIQRILDANEELRIASDLLISKQRNGLAGSVPTEVLSARSASVLPGGPISPGTNYVNVPQGAVEIAPASKGP
jgi:hypothetical protein